MSPLKFTFSYILAEVGNENVVNSLSHSNKHNERNETDEMENNNEIIFLGGIDRGREFTFLKFCSIFPHRHYFHGKIFQCRVKFLHFAQQIS